MRWRGARLGQVCPPPAPPGPPGIARASRALPLARSAPGVGLFDLHDPLERERARVLGEPLAHLVAHVPDAHRRRSTRESWSADTPRTSWAYAQAQRTTRRAAPWHGATPCRRDRPLPAAVRAQEHARAGRRVPRPGRPARAAKAAGPPHLREGRRARPVVREPRREGGLGSRDIYGLPACSGSSRLNKRQDRVHPAESHSSRSGRPTGAYGRTTAEAQRLASPPGSAMGSGS
jgi:hypothetical protein